MIYIICIIKGFFIYCTGGAYNSSYLRSILRHRMNSDTVHNLISFVPGNQMDIVACGSEAFSLNIALKPFPFGPGPMKRNEPLPALNEL